MGFKRGDTVVFKINKDLEIGIIPDEIAQTNVRY